MGDSADEGASFDVTFPSDFYSSAALKRAAYVLMDRATVSYRLLGAEIVCLIVPETRNYDRAVLERDFRREVLDQDLRMEIESKTGMMRDTILGLTFSRSGLQG